MRRSEATQAYQEFLRLKAQVLEGGERLSRGGIEEREHLWTLVERLKEDIEVFNAQEKEEILSVSEKVIFRTPLLRNQHRRNRSRSESLGRSHLSSVTSASFLSADMSNTDGDSLASLMEAKLAMEEEMEEMQAEQRRKSFLSQRRWSFPPHYCGTIIVEAGQSLLVDHTCLLLHLLVFCLLTCLIQTEIRWRV